MGPGRQTYVLIYAIYDKAFNSLSFGYSAALTVVLFGLIVVCSLLLLLLTRRRSKDVAIDEDEVVTPPLSWNSSGRSDRFAALTTQRFESGPRRAAGSAPPCRPGSASRSSRAW